ncbi:MAG TPA: serine/threonine-protein kinase [Solirubrobacterales bacterium]|nr:serine/threonine-protein kinase [Solirubrobacterales bacterium]
MVGSLVLDRFLIERRIGSGGFGVVYEAWDGRLERPVAVKAIERRGDQEGRRVLREAQAAARLNHPGIVTLYEMGEEDGNALLVSELVEGSTLAHLAAEDVLSDREIGEIGADLCEALDHAHSRGVIHRDIKPQNVQIVEGQPRAKLMDFGIALVADAAGLTATGDVVGTLAYMSPEQAEGREAGPEADVYSLALTLYECWSGENPHRHGNAVATVRSIGRRARPLRRLRPDLPRELTEAIDACLDPRPRHRPCLEELGTAIEESLEELADHPHGGASHLGLRLGALGVAAAVGALVVLGHGLVLP